MADEKAIKAFVGVLSQSERMLVTLRDELYEGKWGAMEEDLKNRLNGKPYIFKLVDRIEKDLAAIVKLRDFETGMKINLKDFID
jgi:hypothetical protein